MNSWNKLLAILDKIYGHGAVGRSRISRKQRGFDNKSGEHVIRIEYRVKLLDESDHSLIRDANDRLLTSIVKDLK